MTYLLDYENAEKNFKLVKTTITAYDTVGTSWANVSGSQIAYTPASGASKVIYEFSSAYGYLDEDNSLEIKLQIGNDLSSVGDVVTNNVYQFVHGQNVIGGYFILDSWSGSNDLKLTGKTYDNQREITLHEDEAGNHFDPIIKVYSLT